MRLDRLALSLVSLLILAAPAAIADTISFDEIPPANNNSDALGEEYAALGVHFVTTDDGSIWSGISDGDPGGWGLEGTNGSAFVGFNGRSYSLVVLFDEPVPELQIDVARSLFSKDGDTLVVEGYREGVLVEEIMVPLGAVGEWTTVLLSEPVDEAVWRGEGVGSFHPFGIDNMSWGSAEPEVTLVDIDVWPSRRWNFVNPFSRKMIKVALLGGENIDVIDVDEATLGFGPSAAAPLSRWTRSVDVNRDGLPDLVLLFRIRDTGIAFGDPEACLTGKTYGGTSLAGCDQLRTPSRRHKRMHWHR